MNYLSSLHSGQERLTKIGSENIQKTLQFIALCVGLSLIALLTATVLTISTVKADLQFRPDSWIMETDYYNNVYLTHSGTMGDCGHGNLYPSPYTTSVTTYLDSASPSGGYTIYAGCCYPLNGTPHFSTLYAPGHGPTCSTPTYAIWGNGGQTDETCNFRVTYWTSSG